MQQHFRGDSGGGGGWRCRRLTHADTIRTAIPSTLKVLAEAWLVFGNVPVDFDAIDGSVVQVRIVVRELGKLAGERLLERK